MVNLNAPVEFTTPPLIFVLCVLCFGFYVKSLKFCIVSRCSKIKLCGIECDRDVLNGEDAIELATHNSNPNFPMMANNSVPNV